MDPFSRITQASHLPSEAVYINRDMFRDHTYNPKHLTTVMNYKVCISEVS